VREPDTWLQDRVIELTKTHGASVYALALRHTNSEADAEDLLQDIWIRVLEALPDKHPETPWRAWVLLVAMNVASEWRNRRKWSDFKARAFRYFSFERDLQQVDPEPEIRNPTRDRVWAAIDELPELQREVVLMRVFHDMSTKQTAKAIHRSEGTVKSSLHRALTTLRSRLGELEELWEGGDL